MTIFRAETIAEASPETVFESIANIGHYSKIQPQILRYEFLTDKQTGVGTKFRETRGMGNRENTTVLEITRYEPPQANHAGTVRFIADAGGTIWDSTFMISPNSAGPKVNLAMTATAKNPLAAVMNWFIKGMIKRGLENDLSNLAKHLS